MKDILQDLVSHTHSLGILPLLKVSTYDDHVEVDSIADDKSVMFHAKTHTSIPGIESIFGMPNLNKLDLYLKCPEYAKDAVLTVVHETRNGVQQPVGLHFTNATNDFENDYRFMSREIIEAKIKKLVSLTDLTYDLEFKPESANVTRLKFQAAVHTEEIVFQTSSDSNNNLIFTFGDESTHAGTFVFQTGLNYKLKNTWSWPISTLLSILNLDGTITMKISDQGVLQIIVESDIATYTYTLPAQTK